MFRITENPSSGSLVQRLPKNYKSDSIVSVDMEKVGVMVAFRKAMPSYTVNYTHAQRVRICCYNTDLAHVNGHESYS